MDKTAAPPKTNEIFGEVIGFIRKNGDNLSRLSAVIIIFVILIIISPRFANVTNLLNVLRVASLNIIIATGMAMCMMVTGIDLSVGAVIALSTIMFGQYFQGGTTTGDMVFGIVGILVVSAVIGAVNGYNVAFLGLPPFLATYGMQQVARGLSYYLTKGAVFSNFTNEFQFLGAGYVFGIPMPVIFAALLLVVVGFILNKTTLGRRIYAVGSNKDAALYSGINVKLTLMIVYTMSALIAGFGGIIYISRLNCAEPTIGMDFAQNAIAAAAIGGISFKGGRGNVFGIIIGALMLTFITNGMNLLGINSNWQMGVTGAIILIAVLIDRNTAKKKV
jgi:ribose transport system permease protein